MHGYIIHSNDMWGDDASDGHVTNDYWCFEMSKVIVYHPGRVHVCISSVHYRCIMQWRMDDSRQLLAHFVCMHMDIPQYVYSAMIHMSSSLKVWNADPARVATLVHPSITIAEWCQSTCKSPIYPKDIEVSLNLDPFCCCAIKFLTGDGGECCRRQGGLSIDLGLLPHAPTKLYPNHLYNPRMIPSSRHLSMELGGDISLRNIWWLGCFIRQGPSVSTEFDAVSSFILK